MSLRAGAVERLIKVIGDMDMLAIKRDQAKQFREWWSMRTEEDLSTEGGRKDITTLSTMIREICKNAIS
jgi:hypothetical protein